MTTAKIRRMLQVMRDQLTPSELLIITIPPDSQAPVTHWVVSLELARRHRSVGLCCDAQFAAEVTQQLHRLSGSRQRSAILFPEHSTPRADLLIKPALGCTAEQVARDAHQGMRTKP